ncbi:cob(I)yrinic acid a,c-diamide adenosyltransferase [Spiroplasma platyhelix]|uniref:Cob(I)yrinic acid a,c-diamide adenosyltransferase n=1 Tax=Spiroplasma platyhelix PALS-1 TaxID=1276218 RepID=A0A846U0I7_9MOLU|nr:cob(I)yrinic acid a,c-diamide adenosyltransferase [Spiroplasma platyhelix]MBE4703973.1 Cob(I)yrinic acid a,c-diamide adenosyltransferase [Spiroplasma platyhelix PALS-1]NKE38346.1 cob(I)yrinic acid a,c-diamide adenosyltransferase [Spiroplasma platyhelix PALS-1]UJB29231.1 cob(I)alamin adenosyltransferase [Spiroplasma platyhelix PALS-1]
MLQKGYIHIYKGEGKGKTSILNGMVIRALGNNLRVYYLRFLKNRPSGEIDFLNKVGEITIKSFYNSSTKFFWEMDEQEKELLKDETNQGLQYLKELSQSDNVDLIVVDEILGCIQNNLIKEQELISILKNKKPNIEIALSGRYASFALEQIADLISEVSAKKHYFEDGQSARKGIDY